MTYLNRRTGAIIETSCNVSGQDWQEVLSPAVAEAETEQKEKTAPKRTAAAKETAAAKKAGGRGGTKLRDSQ